MANTKFERYKIECFKPIKIANIKESIDMNGKKYWKCTIPMFMRRNGKLVCYEYICLKSKGECKFKNGDIIQLTKIISYHSGIMTTYDGGKDMVRTLEVEIEPYNRENEEEE